MSTQKTSHPFALGLLMNEDLYHFSGDEINVRTISEDQQILAPVEVKEPRRDKEAERLPEVKQASEAAPEPNYFEYLGENNKYTLILVNEPAYDVLGPKEMETLLNILKGKKQDLNDVALLNIRKYPTATFPALKEFFACNSIIFFGINPSQLKIDGVQANQISVHGNTRILATYSITEMLNSVEKKRAFWDEMKKL